ncbi:hypothetical protein F4778DRAFT_258705 [Xylariomycetidae sp. FL2044]|nr:hypothetical protein F4778DRAFT_258705 [Xylariomycetidae sp. FL2044]
MRLQILLAAAGIRASWAQGNDTLTVDPDTVDLTTRSSWCTTELSTCNTLCGQIIIDGNSCDASTLEYQCKCANGGEPDMTQFKQTIPYFMCEQSYSNCVASASGDAAAQTQCEEDIGSQCPTKAAEDVLQNHGTTTTADSSTSTSAPAATTTTHTASSTTGTTSTAATITPGLAGPNEGGSNDDAGQAGASSTSDSSGLSTGAKAGIGVGAALGGILIFGVIGYLLWRLRKMEKRHHRHDDESNGNAQFEKPELAADTTWYGHELHADHRHEMDAPAVPVEKPVNEPVAIQQNMEPRVGR